MKSENYSERIHQVLAKNISLIPQRKIEWEADWQTWLYCDFKDEFIEDKNILILLEGRIRKGNNNITWFSPDKYNKRKDLLMNSPKVEIDNIGWAKVTINPSDQTNSKLRSAIEEEAARRFYVDIIIKDESENTPIAIIEMKFNKNLDESYLNEDIEKLKRIKVVSRPDCIMLVVGYCLNKHQYYCHDITY